MHHWCAIWCHSVYTECCVWKGRMDNLCDMDVWIHLFYMSVFKWECDHDSYSSRLFTWQLMQLELYIDTHVPNQHWIYFALFACANQVHEWIFLLFPLLFFFFLLSLSTSKCHKWHECNSTKALNEMFSSMFTILCSMLHFSCKTWEHRCKIHEMVISIASLAYEKYESVKVFHVNYTVDG